MVKMVQKIQTLAHFGDIFANFRHHIQEVSSFNLRTWLQKLATCVATAHFDMIMINLTTLPNYSKSLIVESKDYISPLFCHFQKMIQLNNLTQCYQFGERNVQEFYPQ